MSPRPRKHRRCTCRFIREGITVFKPAGIPVAELGQIVLPHDELEALLLCDREGLSQEEAGERMGVSRGTVQRLVKRGRLKVASALGECMALVIEPA
jgi:predicted DNA-binding protein (UPF0251 family)